MRRESKMLAGYVMDGTNNFSNGYQVNLYIKFNYQIDVSG